MHITLISLLGAVVPAVIYFLIAFSSDRFGRRKRWWLLSICENMAQSQENGRPNVEPSTTGRIDVSTPRVFAIYDQSSFFASPRAKMLAT
jgi:hypothetical protein